MLHTMDAASRYSAAAVVKSTSIREAVLREAVHAFDSSWLGQLWPPDAVLGDQAFNKGEFEQYLTQLQVETKPIPARSHNKNVAESKHNFISSIFLRLKGPDTDQSFDL